MPNTIKYSTTGDTQSLKKGNFYFGVGDVGKGATSGTSYWNGISPPTSGYTIYINKASNGPSIYVASNDTQLINFTKGFSGQNFTGATDCLNWYLTQSTYACVNIDYESIITSGLTFCFDAGFTPSYSTSGVTWYDISYGGNNGTLTNGPTFNSSNGGSIVFDGIDDYVNWNNNPISALTTSITYDVWIKFSGAVQNAFTITSSNFKVYHQNDSTWYVSGTGTGNKNISWTYTTEWSNFVYSFDGTNHICYINGSPYTVNSGAGVSSQSNLQVSGRNSGSLPLKGNISITRVYNRGLSASEILQNYNAQKSRYVASFDPDAQAFITAANITNSTQQTAINTLVVGLKADNIWTKMSAIYPIVGGTATNHKYNLKDPRDLDVAFRLGFYGGITHSSNGMLFNGTNGWADTFIGGMVQSFGAYARNSTDNGGDYVGSQWSIIDPDPDVGETYVSGYHVNYGYYEYSDLYGIANTNNTTALGLHSVNYGQTLYRNGTLKSSSTSYSIGYVPSSPQITLAIGATNPNSQGTPFPGYSNQQIAFSFVASTILNSTDNANLYSRVQAFQTSLGRQV